MANSADPGQLASLEANWSGSTLFAKAGCIPVQQDKGLKIAVFFDIFQKVFCFYLTLFTEEVNLQFFVMI